MLQSAGDMPAEMVANVTIDTITYTPEGAVQLSGRGTAERAVRVYLDNAPVADAAISAAGDWAVTRDGGARLNVNDRLYGSVRDYHTSGIDAQWGRVWK